ncbi:hypothetical protein D3C73_1199440 [compost metagenome]
MPGQAFRELSTPNKARNGGTTRVNSLPHSGFWLAMQDAKAITKKDCAARYASVRLARILVSY